GRRYLASQVAQHLAFSGLQGPESPFDKLSPRELEVARMLCTGMRMEEIGRRLSLSGKTVATHKYRLSDKLGIRDAVALARLAAQHGLSDPAYSLQAGRVAALRRPRACRSCPGPRASRTAPRPASPAAASAPRLRWRRRPAALAGRLPPALPKPLPARWPPAAPAAAAAPAPAPARRWGRAVARPRRPHPAARTGRPRHRR